MNIIKMLEISEAQKLKLKEKNKKLRKQVKILQDKIKELLSGKE